MTDWLGAIGIGLQIVGVVIVSTALWYKLAREGDPKKPRIHLGDGKIIELDFWYAVKRRAPIGIPFILAGLGIQMADLLLS